MNRSGNKVARQPMAAADKGRVLTPRRFQPGLVLIGLFLFFALGGGSALADESGEVTPVPGSPAAEEQIFNYLEQAIESGNPKVSEASVDAALTSAQAAEELPHRELGRSEALELMQQVFGSELQAPAGIFDELEVQKFLSDYAAIIPAGSQATPEGVMVGDGKASQEAHATLLESTTPLRAPDALGREQPVDLSLEHSEGELQPVNPLVELGVPQELGEGIELPDAGVRIEFADAPQERAPSTVDGSVAVYPEVAKDTSLAVAPTPAGVETLTLLQSADAPRSESFHIDLPDGATLQQAEGGGAEVLEGDEVLLVVEPPTAIDANGEKVSVDLKVSGNMLILQASLGLDAAFPILLDPVYDTFNWNGVSTTNAIWNAVIYGGGFSAAKWATCSNTVGAANQCGSPLTQNTPGLYASASAGVALKTGAWAQEAYFVPRSGSDYNAYGTLPSSFIESMTINHLGFWHRSDSAASPYLAAGIWAGTEAPVWGGNPAGWASLLTWGGNQGDINETLQYTFPGNGNHNAKEALVGMVAAESHTMSAYRDALFREVTISIGDTDKPGFAGLAPPETWMDQTPLVIGYGVSDAGLGVASVTLSDRQTPQHSWTTSVSCLGTNDKPCPHTLTAFEVGGKLKYEPSLLPTGLNTLDIKATDPVGNTSATSPIPVKVDHTAPTLAVTGSLTEQATKGTSRPRYIVKASASDGTSAAPQSGVAGIKVAVDGAQVKLAEPGCSTQNCSLSTEWTLNSASYSVGSHTVAVTATDAVGRSTTKTAAIQIARDTTKPTFGMGGEVQAAPDSWVNQRNYTLYVGANDSGYGVSKAQFLVDGKAVSGGLAEQSCVEGGCALNQTFTINMAAYSGGQHTGTVVVTDGAGNKTEVSNPFRVNPSGTISASEASKTLSAADTTSGSLVVARPLLLPEAESAERPGLEVVGSQLKATETDVPLSISTESKAKVTIEAPDGTVKFSAKESTAQSTSLQLVNGAAGVTANTSTKVDSVVRPIFDGVTYFKAIRDSAAPEEYSWTVELTQGQTFEQVSENSAQVWYSDKTPAMLIAAEGAHDATGAEVPVSLKVTEGNVLTLIVHHHTAPTGHAPWVYPIVGGAGFQTGYATPIAAPAPEAKEERDARLKLAEEEQHRVEEEEAQFENERVERENEELQREIEILEQEIANLEQEIANGEAGSQLSEFEASAPEVGTASEAEVEDLAKWSGKILHRHIRWITCHKLPEPPHVFLRSSHFCGNPFTNDEGESDVAFNYGLRADYWIVPGEWVKHAGGSTDHIECAKMYDRQHIEDQGIIREDYFIDPAIQCKWYPHTADGDEKFAEMGRHITPYGEWHWGEKKPSGYIHHVEGLAIYLWASGHIGLHQTTCIDC